MPAPGRKKTLDRVLSQAGIGSRKEARQWIGAGRVAVDGKKIQTPDAWVDPEHQRVTLDGKPLRAAKKIYLLLYKPKGYVTTYKDPDGRPTVYDLLKDVPEKVFSAGRLDLDSTGLLIFTNDGEFADRITSPESHVPKTYLVKSSLLLTDDQLDQLRQAYRFSGRPHAASDRETHPRFGTLHVFRDHDYRRAQSPGPADGGNAGRQSLEAGPDADRGHSDRRFADRKVSRAE